jgi:alkylated DNA repair dioxygenase AlkB
MFKRKVPPTSDAASSASEPLPKRQKVETKAAAVETKASAPAVEAKLAGAGASSRVKRMIETLVSVFMIVLEGIRIVGAGDSILVPGFLQAINALKEQYSGLPELAKLMTELGKEFNWLNPADPRAAVNRQGKPMPRMKACKRKARVDAKGSATWPFYGNYPGSRPLHYYASGPLSETASPLTFMLCEIIDTVVGSKHNHVLGTKYRNESDQISAHSDKYQDLVDGSFITSLSFGATRDLVFEPVTAGQGKRFTLALTDGALFVMGPKTNAAFTHCVPPSKTPTALRMSLIFRQVAKHVKTDPKPTKSKAKAKGPKDKAKTAVETKKAKPTAATVTTKTTLTTTKEEKKTTVGQVKPKAKAAAKKELKTKP